jgi:hypothetical protein
MLIQGFSLHAAPILVIDASGILTGARNVDVQGTLYDVDFRDGTCIALFGGCDAASDFAFQSAAAAVAASQALLDFVFVDSGVFDYDIHPELTQGCFGPGGPPLCFVFTPFSADGVLVTGRSQLTNSDVEALDMAISGGSHEADFDSTLDPFVVYAVWSAAAVTSPAPEPETLSCLAIAGLALVLARRRNRNLASQR